MADGRIHIRDGKQVKGAQDGWKKGILWGRGMGFPLAHSWARRGGLGSGSSSSSSRRVWKEEARRPPHTTEDELGMPWMVALLGVPLIALKMCSESGRTLFMPSSTGLIGSCMMADSSLARSL